MWILHGKKVVHLLSNLHHSENRKAVGNSSNSIQKDLDHVIAWAKRNNMVLHEDKFELLVHRGNPNESLMYELPFVCQTQTYKVSGDRVRILVCCQVLLILPGLMSVRIALRGEAALVSIKKSYFYTLYAVYGQLL